MTKVCISDLDGAFGDCEEAARELGILKDYKELKDNPDRLETDDFRQLDWNTLKSYNFLTKKFTVYEGGPELINLLIDNGYEFYFSTNNMLTSLPGNQEILREKFSYNGVKPEIGFHTTRIIEPDGSKPRIVGNGSKKDFAERKFKYAEKGLHISDNRHELDSASYVNRLNTEKFYDIVNIKLGDEDLVLYNGMNMTYKKNISDILKDKDLIKNFVR